MGGVYSKSCQFCSSIDGKMELMTAAHAYWQEQGPSFYILGGLSLMDVSLAKKKDWRVLCLWAHAGQPLPSPDICLTFSSVSPLGTCPVALPAYYHRELGAHSQCLRNGGFPQHQSPKCPIEWKMQLSLSLWGPPRMYLGDGSWESWVGVVGVGRLGCECSLLVDRSFSAPTDCCPASTRAQSFRSFSRSPKIIF